MNKPDDRPHDDYDFRLEPIQEDARDLDDVRAALRDPTNRERVVWDELKARLEL